jgi:transcription termination/antitermination protein NusG
LPGEEAAVVTEEFQENGSGREEEAENRTGNGGSDPNRAVSAEVSARDATDKLFAAIDEQALPERTGHEPPPGKAAGENTEAADTEETAAPDDGEEEEAEDTREMLELREVPDDGLTRRWYAIHSHSGQESNVRQMLLAGAEQLDNPDLITNVFVPMEKVTEVRGGSTRTAQHKFFPSYVLLQLPEHPEQYPDLWHLIRETTGVTGFIGSRNHPVPLEDEEVNAIIEVIRGERERPKPKVAFEKGERIKIIDGPFANFLGRIDEINAERGTMKVMVEIFERLTSIEVEFWQVEQV